MRCPRHEDIVFDDLPSLVVHLLGHLLDLETAVTHLGVHMSEFQSDEQHLQADVDSLTASEASEAASFAAALAADKAANPGADFTNLDAVTAKFASDAISEQAELNPVPAVPETVSDTPVADDTAAATGVDPNAA